MYLPKLSASNFIVAKNVFQVTEINLFPIWFFDELLLCYDRDELLTELDSA